MRRAPLVLLTTALAIAAVAAAPEDDGSCRADPDGATITVDGAEVPVEHCQTTLFAQCGDAVGGKVIVPTETVALAADAPTTSFTAGGGCGTVDEPVFASQSVADGMYQFAATGFARAGSVDNLTVEAHFLGPNAGYVGEDLHLDVRITVDGVSLFGTRTSPDATGDNVTTAPAFQRVVVPAVVSDSMASVGVEFTVTDLDQLLPPVAPGSFRSIEVSFGVPHTGQCQTLPTNDTPRCAPSGFTGWVLGATEVPSGVTFSDATPAPTLVPAVLADEA